MMIYNPHLEGDPFLWEGGTVGVLLIHGFTATTAEVRPMGNILHEHGYTVAGPLLPGHYTKPADLNRVHWQDWVRTAESAYHELKRHCTQIIVGGESTGALLALYLASEFLEIRGVLAYAPALQLAMSNFDRLRLYLISPFIPFIPKQNMDDDTPWQGYSVNPTRGVIQLLRLQKEIYKRLPAIHQPILLVQGRLDATVHPTVPALIAESVSSQHTEIHWMENSRHVAILDKELNSIAKITLDFISHACLGASE